MNAMTNEQRTLKHLAAELDQTIELLEIHVVGKQMLRDVALKTVVAAMQGKAEAGMLHAIAAAFAGIHRQAIAGRPCLAERLLDIAQCSHHNAAEIAKYLVQGGQANITSGDQGHDKSGG